MMSFRTPAMAGVLWACLALSALMQPQESAAQAATQPQLRIEPGSHAGPLRRAAVDPNGRWVVTTSDDKTARIWSLDPAETSPRQILRPPSQPGGDGRLYAVAVHPRTGQVAVAGVNSGNAVIYLFDPDTGRQVGRIDGKGRDIRRMAWTPDGTLLVAAFSGDPAIRAFDERGTVRFERTLSAPSYDLDISPDGSRIAVSSRNARVLVLRIERNAGEPVRITEERTINTFPGEFPAGLSFSPDGATLAVGFGDGNLRESPRTDGGPPSVAQVHLYKAASGGVAWRTDVPSFNRGGLQGVRFTRDGRHVYAAGTGYRDNLKFAVLRLDAESGRISGELPPMGDSIMDLQALPDGRVAYTGFDGSWGVIGGLAIDIARSPGYAAIRGADAVRTSEDGRRVGWTSVGAPALRTFDLRQRLMVPAATPEPADLRPSAVSAFASRLTRWEDNFAPLLDGSQVTLESGEVSRAAAALRDGRDIVLGSSRNLRRLGPGAARGWQVPTQSEVRSVQTADNDRLIVTAMSDGTIRWWRARDGELLLSLYASSDGRWVAWTESGFFDAGAGGETLVGWHVNRGNGEGADFFSMSRFRASFLRPDVIDRVLDDLDVPLAVTRANEARRVAAAAEAATPQPGAAPEARPADFTAAQAPARLRQTIPPALNAVGRREVRAGSTVDIAFTVRAEPGNPAREIFTRVDGRPLDIVQSTLPGAQDGNATGTIRLAVPSEARSVQVFARSDRSVSEPLEFTVTAGAAAPAGPKPVLYMLAVGVSAYARTQYNLNFPAKDARDIVSVISRQKGVLYRDVVVRTLLDSDARRPRILEGLKWLQSQVGPGDAALVFIAGHGVNDALGRYYFMPHDGRVEQLRGSGVADTEFRSALAAVKGKVYLFVDTCRAASIAGITGAGGEVTRIDTDVSRVVNDLSAPEHGVQVLAASSGRQDSLENPAWGNGAFTKAVVEGLNGLADQQPKDGAITFNKLDRFVGVEVRRLTSGRQTPVALTPRGGQTKSLLALVP